MTETFRNLVAWQKAKTLAKDIYVVTRGFPKEEVYGLTIQMRRAAISVPSNIAEGKGRNTRKDYCHFLMQARGSLYELETQIELAVDLGYVESESARSLVSQCDELGRILNGLIRSLQ
jgi:four helix bundle protein